MNITRRTLLKSIGIGTAVAVSGVSVASSKNESPWEHVEAARKLMDSCAVPEIESWPLGDFETWSGSQTYDLGDKIIGGDGLVYECKATH